VRAIFAGLDEGIKLIGVVGQLVGLQDHQLASTRDYRWIALQRLVSQFPEPALGLA